MKPGRRNNTNKVSLSNVITQTHLQISSRLLPTLISKAILRVRQLLFLQITENWKNFFLSFKIVKPTGLSYIISVLPLNPMRRFIFRWRAGGLRYVKGLSYLTTRTFNNLIYCLKRKTVFRLRTSFVSPTYFICSENLKKRNEDFSSVHYSTLECLNCFFCLFVFVFFLHAMEILTTFFN